MKLEKAERKQYAIRILLPVSAVFDPKYASFSELGGLSLGL